MYVWNSADFMSATSHRSTLKMHVTSLDPVSIPCAGRFHPPRLVVEYVDLSLSKDAFILQMGRPNWTMENLDLEQRYRPRLSASQNSDAEEGLLGCW